MKFVIKLVFLVLFFLIPLSTFAHGVSSVDQTILTNGGLCSYIYVGAKHMLTGYDHLLFLAGVVFYLKNFKDIVKFITVFTIAHCVTLTGATYLGISANEHLVDAVIALSVLYKGFENLEGFKKMKLKVPNLLVMLFLFGLIHGFGLSTRLQSFDIGSEQFLLKIFSFNLGVEIGQILALIPIVFLITSWRNKKSYPAFYKAINTYLIIIGLALFCYQLYGYFR
ncbi:HupE/UreJ family protein [uncultured Polaribacter sp.]|uniref:HupE/UreJ family protein n=1 Tax=uncultured Polaribacter sp. TaxID=174711 RepID=UPI00262D4E12|nr:HupE/UreJ family protein [uncultured Polaribacter sp.]